MGGQDRRDQRAVEEGAQRLVAAAGRAGAGEHMHDGADARLRTGEPVHPGAADVVLVLGDIGEVGEIAEGADDLHGLGGREAVQDLFQVVAGVDVGIAVEADRGLADAFDQIENPLPLLLPHGVAEEAAEKADVVPQRLVFVHGGVRRHVVHGGVGSFIGYRANDVPRRPTGPR